MIVKQCELWDENNHVKLVWLDASQPLKPGNIVIGKDGKSWRINHVYSGTTVDLETIHTDWKVGGLYGKS